VAGVGASANNVESDRPESRDKPGELLRIAGVRRRRR
jgi:hypothetical protein